MSFGRFWNREHLKISRIFFSNPRASMRWKKRRRRTAAFMFVIANTFRMGPNRSDAMPLCARFAHASRAPSGHRKRCPQGCGVSPASARPSAARESAEGAEERAYASEEATAAGAAVRIVSMRTAARRSLVERNRKGAREGAEGDRVSECGSRTESTVQRDAGKWYEV